MNRENYNRTLVLIGGLILFAGGMVNEWSPILAWLMSALAFGEMFLLIDF